MTAGDVWYARPARHAFCGRQCQQSGVNHAYVTLLAGRIQSPWPMAQCFSWQAACPRHTKKGSDPSTVIGCGISSCAMGLFSAHARTAQ